MQLLSKLLLIISLIGFMPGHTVHCMAKIKTCALMSMVALARLADGQQAVPATQTQVSLSQVHSWSLCQPPSYALAYPQCMQINGSDERAYEAALVSPVLVYEQRYSENFKMFLKKTNEKQVALELFNKFINSLNKRHPDYFKHGVSMYDIGLGDGRFSSSIAQALTTVVPQGASGVTFAGIDPQESFVQSAKQLMQNIGIEKPHVTVGDFMTLRVPENERASANFVLASHSAHVFDSMPAFIEKVQTLVRPNAITVLLHNKVESPIEKLRKKFTSILKQSVTGDTPLRIEQALEQARLDYSSFEFHPVVAFPVVSNKDFQALHTIKTGDYHADYSHMHADVRETKKLIEFFLKDPLEAFTQEQRTQLFSEFKKTIDAHHHLIPLPTVMHVVVSRDSDIALKQAIEQSLEHIQN